jgi:hypothetical protein
MNKMFLILSKNRTKIKMVLSTLSIADKYIKKIGSVLLTLIAIIGNSLVFYILTRPKFLKESIFRYFLVSEIAATLSLVILWMYSIPSLIEWNVPIDYCRLMVYMFYTLYKFYPWVNILLNFI